jgi:hypothetical protein
LDLVFGPFQLLPNHGCRKFHCFFIHFLIFGTSTLPPLSPFVIHLERMGWMKVDIVIPEVDYDALHFWQGSYPIDSKYHFLIVLVYFSEGLN